MYRKKINRRNVAVNARCRKNNPAALQMRQDGTNKQAGRGRGRRGKACLALTLHPLVFRNCRIANAAGGSNKTII